MIAPLFWFVLGFACGSVPFGWLVGQSRGIDVRRFGSGNIGATNVARTLGWFAGFLTLVGDVTKGAAPTLLATSIGTNSWSAALAALGAVFGHVFSPFLHFRGGKGVATAAGAIVVLAPGPTLVATGIFVLATYFSGYVSVGSLAAAAALPMLCWAWGVQKTLFAVTLPISALIWFRHRDNLHRLANGTERKFRLRWQ